MSDDMTDEDEGLAEMDPGRKLQVPEFFVYTGENPPAFTANELMKGEHAGATFIIGQIPDTLTLQLIATMPDGRKIEEYMLLLPVVNDWVAQVVHEVEPGVATRDSSAHH